jgi:hypothetical protein
VGCPEDMGSIPRPEGPPDRAGPASSPRRDEHQDIYVTNSDGSGIVQPTDSKIADDSPL